ncbi:YczE/YyaS/YitT family protein [Propioniciclava coleopterorum]|uniref:membrane protein YczE n=1 Tax=Propioniciclava coleopterorum TaxID=2714937 RepID=UPI001980CC50|nr:hypothetical protein [Propioniciclava coleopterorum]
MALALENRSIPAQLKLDRLPLRFLALFAGLTGFGASVAGMIRAGLGVAPWDVLHVALAERTGLSVGTVAILASLVVLLLWWPLRQLPGLGTLANAVWVGVSCDLTLAVLPPATDLPWAIALMVGSVLLNGVSGSLYIGAQLGAGPRDGLMTGLHRRTGWPIAPVRLAIEGGVLLLGWLLGGPVGVGTVLYAVAMGPIVGLVLPHVLIPVRAPAGAPGSADGDAPRDTAPPAAGATDAATRAAGDTGAAPGAPGAMDAAPGIAGADDPPVEGLADEDRPEGR